MIPRYPSLTERHEADVIADMIRDGWSYVHPADLARARDTRRRQNWWATLALIGVVVIVSTALVLLIEAAS